MTELQAQDQTTITPATRGETYGTYNWAIDVTVPPDWTPAKDLEYALTEIAADPEHLVNYIGNSLEDFHGLLTFAYCYLSGQEFDLHAQDFNFRNHIFRELPIRTRVEMLRQMFAKRTNAKDYRERFDSDLRRFLDVERICFPILERYLKSPKSVWLRQLTDVCNAINACAYDFSESMSCEHEDCPVFVSVDCLNPPVPPMPMPSGFGV